MRPDTNIQLSLSSYELSVLRGALMEFAENHPDEQGGVDAVIVNLPDTYDEALEGHIEQVNDLWEREI